MELRKRVHTYTIAIGLKLYILYIKLYMYIPTSNIILPSTCPSKGTANNPTRCLLTHVGCTSRYIALPLLHLVSASCEDQASTGVPPQSLSTRPGVGGEGRGGEGRGGEGGEGRGGVSE